MDAVVVNEAGVVEIEDRKRCWLQHLPTKGIASFLVQTFRAPAHPTSPINRLLAKLSHLTHPTQSRPRALTCCDPALPPTMDAFTCRMSFTDRLKSLSASASAAKQCAQFALKNREYDEDLFSVILETLQGVGPPSPPLNRSPSAPGPHVKYS